VGGLYAVGISTDFMVEKLADFRRSRIMDINPFALTFAKDGLVLGKRVVKYLNQFIKDKTFKDTKIPLRLIACDLVKGERVIIKSGNLTEAIRASISVPGMFVPVKKGKRILVDGGIVDNLPVGVVRDIGADIVISVDLHSAYTPDGSLDKFLNIGLSAVSLMLKTMVDLTVDKGDVHVKVKQPDVSAMKFNREEIERGIEYGRQAAYDYMEEIKCKIAEKQKELDKPQVKQIARAR